MYCVGEDGNPPTDLGCFERQYLRQISRNGSHASSLDDWTSRCYFFLPVIFRYLSKMHKIKEGRLTNALSPVWAGRFAIGLYISTVHYSIRKYSTRRANSIRIPIR